MSSSSAPSTHDRIVRPGLITLTSDGQALFSQPEANCGGCRGCLRRPVEKVSLSLKNEELAQICNVPRDAHIGVSRRALTARLSAVFGVPVALAVAVAAGIEAAAGSSVMAGSAALATMAVASVALARLLENREIEISLDS